MLRRVVVGGFVQKLRRFAQRQKAMCKPRRYPQLVVQAAQHALGAAAVVVSHKLVAGAGGFVEGFLVEALEE